MSTASSVSPLRASSWKIPSIDTSNRDLAATWKASVSRDSIWPPPTTYSLATGWTEPCAATVVMASKFFRKKRRMPPPNLNEPLWLKICKLAISIFTRLIQITHSRGFGVFWDFWPYIALLSIPTASPCSLSASVPGAQTACAGQTYWDSVCCEHRDNYYWVATFKAIKMWRPQHQ